MRRCRAAGASGPEPAGDGGPEQAAWGRGPDGVEAAPGPASRRACPSPGPNGNHYFVEVDPASGRPSPFSGYLRCKWCGTAFRAYAPWPERTDGLRRVRATDVAEIYRAVEEAL